MRHTEIAVLMTLLLPLCACSGAGGEETLQKAIDFRADVLNAPSCAYTAEVNADYGDVVYEFTMDCSLNADGTTAVTVTAPDTIAGITAEISGGDGTVTFADMALDFGTMAEGNITPVAAPAVIGECWRSAYIASAGEEDGNYRVRYEYDYEDEQLLVDTWFSPEKNIPIYSEICYNEACVLKITISDFQIQTGT